MCFLRWEIDALEVAPANLLDLIDKVLLRRILYGYVRLPLRGESLVSLRQLFPKALRLFLQFLHSLKVRSDFIIALLPLLVHLALQFGLVRPQPLNLVFPAECKIFTGG